MTQARLPTEISSFVGRQRDISEVRRLLRASRLVTLTGTAGVGKTRLALRVAAGCARSWLVELAALTDETLVPQVVASALGLREDDRRPVLSALVQFLGPQRVLLVLDNCEHLVGACAHCAEELLRACPDVRILTTSREPLGVGGETAWPVRPLSSPRTDRPVAVEQLMQYESVRLFVERAAAVSPGFTVTPQNAHAVAEVCCQLDGIPLAIELAAARTSVLAVEQIAERLGDRFALLTHGTRTAAPRHQTLRGAVDWSYGQLSPSERTLFNCLAVFARGWTLEAAEAVYGGAARSSAETLDVLGRLVAKSLVIAELDRDGTARYRMLETLRQFGWEKLVEAGEAAGVRQRHAAFFLAQAEQAEAEWRGPRQADWLKRLELEHDNLRAALDWYRSQDDGVEPGLRLAGALWWFWLVRGRISEGRGQLASVLARAGDPRHRVRPTVLAKALLGAGRLATLQGDCEHASVLLTQSLALARSTRDERSAAAALHDLGIVAHGRGDFEPATELYEESLALSRKLSDRVGTYIALHLLAETLVCRGECDRATALHEESLALKRVQGDSWHIAFSLASLGHLACLRGDYGLAAALHGESLQLRWKLGDRHAMADCLDMLATVASAQGQSDRAARLFGAAESLREAVGAVPRPYHRAARTRAVAATRAAFGEEAFARAWAAGRALPLTRALEYALALAAVPPSDTKPRPPAGEPSAAPLTPREREVAVRVARGLTNRQIAGELVITEGTAGIHVAHILNKLGFHTRAQIAAWAVERGLMANDPAHGRYQVIRDAVVA